MYWCIVPVLKRDFASQTYLTWNLCVWPSEWLCVCVCMAPSWIRVPPNVLGCLTSSYKYLKIFMRKPSLRELTLPMDTVCKWWRWELDLVFKALTPKRLFPMYENAFLLSLLWADVLGNHWVLNSFSTLEVIESILKEYLPDSPPSWPEMAVMSSKLTTCTFVVSGYCVSGHVWMCAGVLSFIADSDTTEHGTGREDLASSKGECILWLGIIPKT